MEDSHEWVQAGELGTLSTANNVGLINPILGRWGTWSLRGLGLAFSWGQPSMSIHTVTNLHGLQESCGTSNISVLQKASKSGQSFYQYTSQGTLSE